MLLFYLLFVWIYAVWAQHVGIKREYCQQIFKPTCSDLEIVIMGSAEYGRMHIGKCMEKDYGLPSCYNDELQFFDKLCSGKSQCELEIPKYDLTSKLQCLNELSPYLEASYSCQKVIVPKSKRCISQETVMANKKMGYLASSISLKTSCGLHESPWILESKEGQHIHIGLIDFAWNNISNQGRHCSLNYGYILDMETDDVIKICGGTERLQTIYKSVGHRVQIVIEGSNLQNYQFVITFEASGCPKYDPPTHAWMQKENNTITIGCQHTSEEWKLKCIDDIWLGVVGECEPPPKPSILLVAKEQSIVASSKTEDESNLASVSENHVVAFAMMCITLIICCTVVVTGFHCTKRYELNMLKQKEQTLTKYSADIGMHGTVRSSMTYKPVGGRETLLLHSNTEVPPYTFPIPKEEQVPIIPQRNPSMIKDNVMFRSMGESDYLTPKNNDINNGIGGGGEEEGSVLYYVLENPSDSSNIQHTTRGSMSDEMYQSIHLNNSLSSNKV